MNDSFIAVNRLLKEGVAVSRTTSSLHGWPAGAFIVEAPRSRVASLASELGLVVQALAEAPGDLVSLATPRLGIYHAWGGNIDEGWTRWVLEQFEFPLETIHDEDLRAGGLSARFDVILLPDDDLHSMVAGLAEGTMPQAYTGGMTTPGLAHLYEFTRAGGTLVAMDSAAELPLTVFGVHVRDVTKRQNDSDFFIPGTILNVDFDPSQPLAWGMPAHGSAFFARSPAFDVGREPTRFERQRGVVPPLPEGYHVVATYPKDGLLQSGWLMGESAIAEKAAVVEARVGKGRVALLGFRVQHRGQAHGTYKLLFNAILMPR